MVTAAPIHAEASRTSKGQFSTHEYYTSTSLHNRKLLIYNN